METSVILQEAFSQLKVLNEEEYNITDSDVDDLKDFMDSDTLEDEVEIIDPEAETEEDIEDSYIDKVVLDCVVCHSKIYKDEDAISIEEGGDLANIGEECPYCYSSDGYTIIGKIAPYVEEEIDVEVEPKEDEEEVEADEEEIDGDVEDIEGDELEEGFNGGRQYYRLNSDRDEKNAIRIINKNTGKVEKEFSFENTGKERGSLSNNMRNQANKFFNSLPAGDYKMVYSKVKPDGTTQDYVLKESFSEALENVDLETEHDRIHIESEEKEVADAEMIAPLDSLEADDIALDAEVDELDDEPLEDEEAPIEDDLGSEDEVNYDIEDFDEDSFNDLGESYLTRVYENVNGFTTKAVKMMPNERLKVEGVIKFKSGNSKKTAFIFEAAEATKRGKVKLIGENTNIGGAKAFTLQGTISDKKFISESLNYRYSAKDSNGKSNRLYGTVKTTKKN